MPEPRPQSVTPGKDGLLSEEMIQQFKSQNYDNFNINYNITINMQTPWIQKQYRIQPGIPQII